MKEKIDMSMYQIGLDGKIHKSKENRKIPMKDMSMYKKSDRRYYDDLTRIKSMTNSIKQFHGCFLCGYDEIPSVLEFHHIDRKDKNFCVSTYRYHWKEGDEKLMDEIDKCIVVCRNCHSIIHTYANNNHE